MVAKNEGKCLRSFDWVVDFVQHESSDIERFQVREREGVQFTTKTIGDRQGCEFLRIECRKEIDDLLPEQVLGNKALGTNIARE